MEGKQSVVALGGLALVGVNWWNSDQRGAISDAFAGHSHPAKAHSALLQMGGELLLVLVVTIVAGMSDSLGTGMLALIAALWILWGIQHYAGVAPGKKKPAAHAAKP